MMSVMFGLTMRQLVVLIQEIVRENVARGCAFVREELQEPAQKVDLNMSASIRNV